jgi:hypothetical protein
MLKAVSVARDFVIVLSPPLAAWRATAAGGLMLVLALVLACGGGVASAAKAVSRGASAVQQPIHEIEQRGTQQAPLVVVGEVSVKKDKEEARLEADERKVKEDSDASLVRYTAYLAVSTFLLFAFTAALWWVTYRLSVEAGKESARQQRETLESLEISRAAAVLAKASFDAYQNAERAWVSLTRIDPIYFSNARYQGREGSFSGVAFSAVWRNAGRSPARKCHVYMSGSVHPAGFEGLPSFDADSAELIGEASLNAGGEAQGQPWPLTNDQVAELERGASVVFLYSRVTYEDVFHPGVKRRGQVLLRLRHNGNVEGGNINWAMTPVGEDLSD